MSSYKRYNDLGSTAREKNQQKAIQEQMRQAQAMIQNQQHELEQKTKELEAHKKELSRRSAFAQREAQARAQNTRGSRGGLSDDNRPQYNGSVAPAVNTRDQKNKMIWSNEICVFKIGAPWCKPCVDMEPRYNALANLVNKPGKIMLFTEEFDRENPNKLSANVEQIPAFDYYFKGKFQHRQTGADFEQVKRNVRMMVNQRNGNGNDIAMQNEAPHPAAGMQPVRPAVSGPDALDSTGKYPPSAMRM
jgi:thiol-disulfide isomerase/thioredoxin